MKNGTHYTVMVHLIVDDSSDENVQTPEALKNEVTSWLSDLGCEIVLVSATLLVPKLKEND